MTSQNWSIPARAAATGSARAEGCLPPHSIGPSISAYEVTVLQLVNFMSRDCLWMNFEYCFMCFSRVGSDFCIVLTLHGGAELFLKALCAQVEGVFTEF